MADFKYRGSELETFARAVNWKRYWRHLLVPFLGHDVLEVGSGIGAKSQEIFAVGANQALDLRGIAIEQEPQGVYEVLVVVLVLASDRVHLVRRGRHQ